MTKTIPELFAMLKSVKVEIKKEHQVLMINTTTSFKKKGKGKERGTSSRLTSKLSLPRRSPKLNQSLKLSAYTAKEMVTGSGTTPNTWRIYMLLMCTLLVFIATLRYLILVQLLRVVTRNGRCKINRD